MKPVGHIICAYLLLLSIFPRLYGQDSTRADFLYQQAVQLADSGNFDSAAHYLNQSIELNQQFERWSPYVVANNKLVWVFLQKGNFRQAEEALEQSMDAAEKHLNETDPAFADTWHKRGLIYLSTGRDKEALSLLENALVLRKKIYGESHNTIAQTLNAMSSAHSHLGNVEKALDLGIQAMEIRKEVLGEKHKDVADSYQNIAVILSEQARYQEQIDYYQKAENIYQNTLPAKHISFAHLYTNMSVPYANLGEYPKQLEYLQKGLAILQNQSGPYYLDLAIQHNNLSQYYSKMGNFEVCLNYQLQSLDYLKKVFDEEHLFLAIAHCNVGMSYLELGETSRALDYFQQGMNICLKLYGESHPEIARIYNYLGLVYGVKKDYERAKTYHQQALDMMLQSNNARPNETALFYSNLALVYEQTEQPDLAREAYEEASKIRLALTPEHPSLSYNYHGLGRIYQKLGRNQEAFGFHQKALALNKKQYGYHHHRIANSYANLGKYYRELNQFHTSLKNYQMAIEALVPAWSAKDLFQLPTSDGITHPAHLIEVLQEKANTLYLCYKDSASSLELLQNTVETYQLALDIFSSYRNQIGNAESRKILASVHQDLFESAIETAVLLYQISGNEHYLNLSFSWTEISKNFLLTEAIRESGAKQFSGIPDSLLEKEQMIRSELAFYLQKIFESQNLETAADSIKKAKWQQRVFELKLAWQELIKTMETTYPDYYQLKFQAQTPTIANTQSEIEDDRMGIISFFMGEDAIYVYGIGRNTQQLHSFKRNTAFNQQFQRFLEILNDADAAVKRANDLQYFEEYIDLATALYDSLLAPVLNNQSWDQLLIVPDGMLGYLPFEVLLSTRPKDLSRADYRKLDYLLHRYRIRYGYSSQMKLTIPQESPPDLYGGFAPSYNASNYLASHRQLTNNSNKQTPEISYLAGNQPEVVGISELLDGRTYLASEATEGAFKSDAWRYRILHLAMHTWVNEAEPLYTGLVFSQPMDSTEDGYLYASEIYNLRLQSELAVLSACQTGYGKMENGEGIMSLARAFRYAGCPNIITSLWQVDDLSTRNIMLSFYSNLKNNMPKDEALQKAKQEFLSSALKKHPHFWAAFMLIGDAKPMDKSSLPQQWWMGGILLLIVLGIYSARRLSKSRASDSL